VVFFEAPHRIRRTLEELKELVGDCRVAIGRELTKVHEESVRGPISAVLSGLLVLKGEFTVVADLGHMIGQMTTNVSDDNTLVSEFGYLTNNDGVDRKHAIGTLTKKYGRTRNDIYAVIERAKNSGV